VAKQMGEGMGEGRKKMAEAIKNVEDATVKTEGDTATMEIKGEKKPLKFKKIGGGWKVDITSIPDLPPESEVAKMKKMFGVMDKVADDVKSGKIKTQEQLTEAMKPMME
jgi:hypothetical protein